MEGDPLMDILAGLQKGPLLIGLSSPSSFWPPRRLSRDLFSITKTTTFLIFSFMFWIEAADPGVRVVDAALAPRTLSRKNREGRAVLSILNKSGCGWAGCGWERGRERSEKMSWERKNKGVSTLYMKALHQDFRKRGR